MQHAVGAECTCHGHHTRGGPAELTRARAALKTRLGLSGSTEQKTKEEGR